MNLPIICIIDDDKLYQFTIQKAIEKTQKVGQIISFPNGYEAISFLKNHLSQPNKLPEVILLDINMPVMDGWQFLNEYLALENQIAKKSIIYIVTSSIDNADKLKVKSLEGVKDFVVKPISKDRLAEILESF
ncbi:MAG: response regulator [Thermoflexibacter sp.]